MARFTFTGEIAKLGALDSKNPWMRGGKTKDGSPYISINFGIKSATNNRANVELFGMKVSSINGFDNDGNKISVDWDDRFDEDVVSNFRGKFRVRLTADDELKEFISAHDMAVFLSEHLEEMVGQKYVITGTVSKDIYNGNVRDRFQIRSVYAASDDAKPGLSVVMEYYLCKDSVDVSDWKSEKKIRFSGYTQEYISDVKKRMYLAQPMVLDLSKINWDNEIHVKRAGLLGKVIGIGISSSDEKPVVTLKGKNYYKLMCNCSYINGAEEKEFNESMLTPMQRELVEAGLATIESYRPRDAVYGERIVEYKFVKPELTGEYTDGIVDTEIKISEFDDEVYRPAAQETVEEVIEKATTKATTDDDSDFDLFG